jgi:DNA polymerase III subunit beta
MKISTLQKNIKRGVMTVSHITSKNINLPILNNIKIEVKEKIINLIATNLEIGITHNLRGKIEEEGEIIIDSKILTNYISLLPNKQVDIETKNNKMAINCENYKTTINGQVGDEFPLIPEISKEKHYIVDSEELKRSLAQVIFAASTNETRLDLSGVLFSFDQKNLFLVATDSYRLAEKRVKIAKCTYPEDEIERRVLVPAKTAQEVVRILSNMGVDEDGIEEIKEIRICLTDNQISFNIGPTELISRLIEGQFPDYRQVIPLNIKTETIVDRNELTRATKAASLFSQNSINDISLEATKKNKLIIQAFSGQVGENTTDLDSQNKGENNSLVLNYRYLLEGLNNIEGENIRLEMVDKDSPCILRPEKEDNYLYIIMPIKQ